MFVNPFRTGIRTLLTETPDNAEARCCDAVIVNPRHFCDVRDIQRGARRQRE
jgi:hypothetical protein